ncbi:uncharacterized protein ARMOST_18814 [Armillaria ostoyae]|uniref:Uncharacterized protein n=1 Tax=Armillaria ostoyae TaxID=47428 RepID=A0A284S2S7_ARMOS|nr:uncharacterized protein ARMOST_18814 [Armillaria ostoyae]
MQFDIHIASLDGEPAPAPTPTGDNNNISQQTVSRREGTTVYGANEAVASAIGTLEYHPERLTVILLGAFSYARCTLISTGRIWPFLHIRTLGYLFAHQSNEAQTAPDIYSILEGVPIMV